MIRGARGAVWRAPDWVMRNACGAVLEVLGSTPGGTFVARHLSESLAAGVAFIDLSAVLADATVRAAWLRALDVAVLSFQDESPAEWNDPSAYAPFVGALRRFADAEHARDATALAATDPIDAVVADLAWIFDDGMQR